ncbi:MAG: alpha/beta hydrolase [Deltaproteobacteria bacterium]
MPDESINRLLQTLRENTPAAGKPIEQLRADFERFYLGFQTGQNPRIKEFTINDIPSFWIEAPGADEKRVILFFHGGGFTIGSTRDHADLCRRLSAASEARVLSIDYRLAPEHIFPAALEDCVASYNWLLNEGFEGSRIIPVGISAGGTLVLSTLLSLRDGGMDLPAAACCMSPAVDMLFQGDSVTGNMGKDWITADRLNSVRNAYLGGRDPKEPLVSPLYADLRGLPPILIQIGNHELLLDDNLKFALQARRQGVDLTFEIWSGMIHCWQIFASELKDGRDAIDSIGKYIKRKFSNLS